MAKTKTEWTRLGDKWFQKSFINSEGKIIISYHFGRKYSAATKKIHIETKLAEQYCSLKLIHKDLRDILIFIDEVEKLTTNDSEPVFYGANKTPEKSILAKGLLTAIVLHYRRCFL